MLKKKQDPVLFHTKTKKLYWMRLKLAQIKKYCLCYFEIFFSFCTKKIRTQTCVPVVYVPPDKLCLSYPDDFQSEELSFVRLGKFVNSGISNRPITLKSKRKSLLNST